MARVVLLPLLLLAALGLTAVHCIKGNTTAAKFKRCSACQLFVRELHDQVFQAADTKETILKQVNAMHVPVSACAANGCVPVPSQSRAASLLAQDAMGYKLRVPYAGSTVQVNDILDKVWRRTASVALPLLCRS